MNKDGLLAGPFRTDDWSSDIPAREERTLAGKAVKTAPVIDGKLDDPAWKEAATALGFMRVNTYHPAHPPRSRVAWDKDNLYVSYECRTQAVETVAAGALKLEAGDNAMGDFASHITDKLDAAFWQGDYVEFRIDPALDHKHYLRFAANPKGGCSPARASTMPRMTPT